MTEQNQKSFYCSLPKVPERVFTEDVNPRRASDDDSGDDTNASLRVKLLKDHKYILRIRLCYSDCSGETAVMMW
ncbi:MAG: hypothetical protein GPI90_12075 [Microcystis aeruginosa K13-05]|jgi:hypothetical protein|uniref:hypothetical protein n=1 Tax=Microcystis sp. LE19-41.2A TaxID=3016427 RepID=UPI0022C063C9|nr:hypothetical protein [Microcystis sp. LE19-41.2A]MCZ8048831.1 hypothetical protein [Microcystis sp. LE19-41.2A]NCR80750.1 hypothetical protein [Microcystis aeruginosa K13-10]NCR85344.1 hypothetical protein [Microcystis aeruginosa K13-05]